MNINDTNIITIYDTNIIIIYVINSNYNDNYHLIIIINWLVIILLNE